MESIKNAVVHLNGDNGEEATAFLVSPEYMLTSKHTFTSNPETITYKVSFPTQPNGKEYTINTNDNIIYEKDTDVDDLANDIAIIKLNEPIVDIEPLILSFSGMKDEEGWISYGYPGAQRSTGVRFSGTVNNVFAKRLDQKFDISLNCEVPKVIDAQFGVGGASGSPIISKGKVVAVFSNQGSGAIIGASSLGRSRVLIEEHIGTLENWITDSSLQKSIKEAISNTERFIDGFPDELHEFLRNELNQLRQGFIENQEDITTFLKNSKYPVANEEAMINGIEATLEIIIMLRSINGNIHILTDDDFANLRIMSQKNIDLSFVYSQERNQIMPEILLNMHNQMINKSAAQIMIESGISIPPHPVILDNFSDSNRHNLCKVCGKTFNFSEILRSYIETEDDDIIKGIKDNTFALLNKAKVLCGGCVRRVRDEVDNSEELKRKLVEKVYDR